MRHWFTSWGWIFKPISPIGWIITVIPALFCLHIFIVVDSASHSVSDTLYIIFPYVVSALTVWYWIAMNTRKK